MATIRRGTISSVQEPASRAGDAPASAKTDGQWGAAAGRHSSREISPIPRGLKEQCIIPSPGERPQMRPMPSAVGTPHSAGPAPGAPAPSQPSLQKVPNSHLEFPPRCRNS